MATKSKKQGKKQLHKRAVSASEKYLERIGCDVLERDYRNEFGKCDLVLHDWQRGEIVFCDVVLRNEPKEGMALNAYSEERIATCERIAMGYVMENPDAVDTPVRFDQISMTIVAENRAFIKHYKNAIGR